MALAMLKDPQRDAEGPSGGCHYRKCKNGTLHDNTNHHDYHKAHPEGSIAEAYLADECMIFCSRYIEGFETKHNRPSRNEDIELVGHYDVEQGPALFPRVGKPLGKLSSYVIRGLSKVQAHRYMLFNCSDVNAYLRAHADEITIKHPRRRVNPKIIERMQSEKFHEWFRAHVLDQFYEPNDGCLLLTP
ncbi:uncharacterized protein LOC133927952 [Phragmites australis]|uniref:uncharacterized protein LOC133927952 n=1 Tax=Phragmites australis TaxID=29695 RepID=UPI002D7A25A4|nr:uncharacterized protein LOC133927952 [Phragmites australis]